MGKELVLEIIATLLCAGILLFAREIWWVLTGFLSKLQGDLPSVSGAWETIYKEHDGEEGSLKETKETVILKQMGRYVWGEISKQTSAQEKFRFKGHLVAHDLIGKHHGKLFRRVTGEGVFMLKVKSNTLEMNGHCVWHDSDSDKIESSVYIWKKQ